MKKTLLTIALFISLALILSAASKYAAFASAGWEANITVAIQKADNKLSFGQKPDATDGKDGLYDIPPMLGGDVKAYFVHEDGALWRDIRALENGKKVWNLRVESELEDEAVQLSWKPENLPSDGAAKLIDEAANKTVDMKSAKQYSYKNDGQRELKIEISR